MKLYTKILILLVLLLQISCGQNQASLTQQADSLCAIYAPGQLKVTEDMNLLDTFNYVNERIRKEINSDEFRAIFKKLAEEGNRDFYGALEKEVSELLGEKWHCEQAKMFYSVTWQRVDGGNEEYLVPIMVIEEKYYVINDSKYIFSDLENIKNAINSKAKDKEFKIELTIPVSTNEEQLNQYLEPFRKLGIKRLSVLEVE